MSSRYGENYYFFVSTETPLARFKSRQGAFNFCTHLGVLEHAMRDTPAHDVLEHQPVNERLGELAVCSVN